jgi:hypothetical protein
MALHRRLAHNQALCYLAVGQPFGHEAENLGLTRGQAVRETRSLRWRPGRYRLHHVLLYSRVDHGLPADYLLECPADLRRAGVLGQVPAGAGLQRVNDRAIVRMVVSTFTMTCGALPRRRSVASTPSQRGMRRSIRMTSGCSAVAIATASSPSAAVPTTSTPGSEPQARLISHRRPNASRDRSRAGRRGQRQDLGAKPMHAPVASASPPAPVSRPGWGGHEDLCGLLG